MRNPLTALRERFSINLARLEGDDYGGGNDGVPRSTRDIDTYWAHYRDNPLVESAMNEVVSALIGIPLVAEYYDEDAETWILLPASDDLQRLLAEPSQTVPAVEFWGDAYLETGVTGTAFMWKRRDGKRKPRELVLFETKHTRPVYAGSTIALGGYVYNPNVTYRDAKAARTALPAQGDVPYDAADVVRVKMHKDPDFPLMGLSPLAAALNDIDLDTAITTFTRAVLNSGDTSSKAFVTKGHIPESEARRLIRRWDRDYAGPKKAGKLKIVDGSEGTLVNIGSSVGPRDMGLVDLKKVVEARVLMALDVPPIIVGSVVGLENSTYSNYAQARLAFHEENTDPNLRRFCSALGHGLAREFHPDKMIRIRPDTSSVMALLDWEDQRIRLHLAAINGGLETQNEGRAAINKRPMPNGDFYMLPSYVARYKVGSPVEMLPIKPPPTVAEPQALKRIRDALGNAPRLMRELTDIATACTWADPVKSAENAYRYSTPLTGESKSDTAKRLYSLLMHEGETNDDSK